MGFENVIGNFPAIEKQHKIDDFEPSLKQKVLNTLAQISIVDKIAAKRAVDIVAKSKVENYLKPHGVYLDIGSGLGHITEEMQKNNEAKDVELLGLEPVWKPLNRVLKRVSSKSEKHENRTFIRATGGNLPLRDNSLDGVSLFFVMHHIPLDGQVMVVNEVKRVLKQDGLLFLVEDTPRNDEEYDRNVIWDKRLNFEGEEDLHNYRSPEKWLEYLKANGFELIEQSDFDDKSPRKNEGVIHHSSFILKRVA
jgi:ubiquinone/menaquinone biosynthesis C-methylase UbiE